MMKEMTTHLDKRLQRIQTLLEEGNQNIKDSRLELSEEIGQLHVKVDRVQDTVTYIKKKMTRMTPTRLGILLVLIFALWIWSLYWFGAVKLNSQDR